MSQMLCHKIQHSKESKFSFFEYCHKFRCTKNSFTYNRSYVLQFTVIRVQKNLVRSNFMDVNVGQVFK